MVGKIVLIVLVVIVFLAIVLSVTAKKAVADYKASLRNKKKLLNSKNKKI